jgi:putative PIN family toxin of toxin-antitoxin system
MSAEKPASIFGLDASSKLLTSTGAKRPAAVLDTNVVLDWLVFRDARVVPLVSAIEGGRVQWLACASMRTELAHMLGHRTLSSWAPDRERALAVFDALTCLRVEPPPTRLKCSDGDDQIFIDLAIASGARWLVTHDRALLKLARRARTLGLWVLAPSAWRDDDGTGTG